MVAKFIPLGSKSVQGQLVAPPLEDSPPAQVSSAQLEPHPHGMFSVKTILHHPTQLDCMPRKSECRVH